MAVLVSISAPTVSASPSSQPEIVQASSQPAVSPLSVNMSTIGRGFETSVAVNPANPSNIIVTGAGSSTGDQAGIVRVTSDGGRTWRYGNASYRDILSVAHGSWGFFDSVGTFDASGNAYVGNLATGGTLASFAMRLFKSTDGGNTFQIAGPYMRMNDTLLDYHTGTMVHPCYEPPGPIVDYPSVMADPYSSSPYKNNVYVLVRVGAQVDPYGCIFGLAFQRSTDGGRTWGSGVWFGGPYTTIGSDFGLSDNRGIAVAPDGTVLLSGNAGCPLVLESTDGGASFVQKPCAATQVSLDSVEVAAASASTIYVVFYGDNGTAFPGVHLYSVVSHDGGNTWSRMVRIDDHTSPDGTHVASAGGPSMWDLNILPQTGRLDVAWMDDRNNGGNYTLADIYYSYSYDGLSWAKNIRATPQGPYYICTESSGRSCDLNGNDFMWVASSYTPGNDKAYIVAALGKADCGPLCGALLTRFVTVTFPSPSIKVSGFFTDPALNPLGSDVSGNPFLNAILVNGVVRNTDPNRVLAWLNVTNNGSMALQSVLLNETLPRDWTTGPSGTNTKTAVRVYYANTTSLHTNPNITGGLSVTLSNTNPQQLNLSVASFNATIIGHPLMPGQSMLVSVKLTYALIGASQSPSSYPISYTETGTGTASSLPSFTGAVSSGSGSAFFTANARILGDPHSDVSSAAVGKYRIV